MKCTRRIDTSVKMAPLKSKDRSSSSSSRDTFQAKRPRVLSDDDPEPSPSSSNGATNSASLASMPSPEVMETRLDCLQKAYPAKVRTDLVFFRDWEE